MLKGEDQPSADTSQPLNSQNGEGQTDADDADRSQAHSRPSTSPHSQPPARQQRQRRQQSYFDGSFLSTSDIPIVDFRNTNTFSIKKTDQAETPTVSFPPASSSPQPTQYSGFSASQADLNEITEITDVSESFPSVAMHMSAEPDPRIAESGSRTNAGTDSSHRVFSSTTRPATRPARSPRSSRRRSARPMSFATSRDTKGSLPSGRWHTFYILGVGLLDILMILVSFVICFGLTHLINPDSLNNPLARQPLAYVVLLIMCITWVVGIEAAKAYSTHTMDEGMELYSSITNGAIVASLMMGSMLFLLRWQPPRGLAISTVVLAYVLTLVERWLMRRYLHGRRRHGHHFYPTIIVGSQRGIRQMVSKLKSSPGVGYKALGVCPIYVDQGSGMIYSDTFVPASQEEENLLVIPFNLHLPQNAMRAGAYTLLIADVIDRESEVMRSLALATESQGLELAIEASTADIASSALHLRHNTEVPILTAQLPQYSGLTRAIKRIFDILLSGAGLILTSPIMLITAIAIRMEDKGPAIYKQKRIGIYGKPFIMYKFRSMYVDADKRDAALAAASGKEHGVLFKMKDDPRITKVGKFIRKTSIDELPQFWNVFKGDMSLIGPRPQQSYEVAQYGTLYSTRLLVKPGISGMWQVSGRSDLNSQDAEYLDVSYVENWSLTGDFIIAIKTIKTVFSGSGAY